MNKADHAGGCYGENHRFKKTTNVSIGKEAHNDFMKGQAATPKLDHSTATSFRPGGTDPRNVGGKRS